MSPMSLMPFLSLGLCFLAACSPDTQVNRYADTAAARRDGLFERGWVPDVLPDTAGPLIEAHDLDSNARCARSDLSPASLEAVVSSLKAAGFAADSSSVVVPTLRTCPFSREDVAHADMRFRRAATATGDNEFAAVARSGVFFFWSSRD